MTNNGQRRGSDGTAAMGCLMIVGILIWIAISIAGQVSQSINRDRDPAPGEVPQQVIEDNVRYYRENFDEACWMVGGEYNPVTDECRIGGQTVHREP